MDRWVGKVAIVTGASAGMGAAIASRLVKEGMKVVGLARREDRLKALGDTLMGEKGKFYGFQTDMRKEEDIIKAFAWTNQNVGPVHVLVNNAGVYWSTPLFDFRTEDAKEILDVNVLGLMIASREALKIFRDDLIDGYIVNINSIEGDKIYDQPGLSVHTASKYAVTALTEFLFLEIKEMNMDVRVTSICPGAVKTDMLDKAAHGSLEQKSDDSFLQVEDIAEATVYVLSRPPHCQIDELKISPCKLKSRGMELVI